MDKRLLAIGDIHGCYDPLFELVEKKISLRKEDRLVLMGDYIDRGKNIRKVIDYIIDLQDRGYDIIALIGNHESMMLDSLENEQSKYHWFMNGGFETLQSFGIKSANELDIKYLRFFRSLIYYYLQDNFIFVHAGFNDDLSDPFEDKVQMIWSRREKYSNPVFNDKIIIHGHTPVPLSVCIEGFRSDNRIINIDTGCVYDDWDGYGHLTAIELYSRQLYFI